ncbi:MAG: hypothetical protein NFW15_00245 [Candidatus Accumulibacter sp.]|nr:hypothetical protein [Accumulibacter sp.]MCM8611219.1 hypothetical protein [Accumulibacter sp.]MCM8634365.1 hypothetical protein [Accumulibacter sp.]MCM8641603.1 hypothetical protein [Accumulibacter sp.]
MNRVVEKLKEELLAVLPPTAFFLIALHIIGFVRALMTQGTGLPVTSSAQIALAALIIGKAVLLADLWPPINRFPEKPLIYNIVWKTVIYYAVASFIHYLERLYDFAREAHGVLAGNEKLLSEIVWPHFLALQIILLVVILNYCVIRELGRVLGERRMLRIFFQQPAAGSPCGQCQGGECLESSTG